MVIVEDWGEIALEPVRSKYGNLHVAQPPKLKYHLSMNKYCC